MRPIFIIAAFTLFSISSTAQKKKAGDTPDWGKVSVEDLSAKTCDFDPDAEAIVLFDVGTLYCNDRFEIEMERHVRIKILNEKGFDEANIRIPFRNYNKTEQIYELAGHTMNLDKSGKIVVSEIDKKSFVTKQIDKRNSETVFAFPDVKEGSIIEYKYLITGNFLRSWYFQQSIPVKYSRYTIDFPAEVELATIPHCNLEYDFDKQMILNHEVSKYIMKNIPALRDEPFILNEDDYLQRLDTRLVAINPRFGNREVFLKSWPEVIKDLIMDPDFGDQVKKNIPHTQDLDSALRGIKDPYLKMKTIHHYVQKHMEWNGYANIWAMSGVKSAWSDKKGTSGEINLILINLLKDAGLSAYPILVSTHDNGLVNTTLPGIAQFNKVMAYVTIGDSFYVLDATDKVTPTHLIPEDVVTNEGLVIEKVDTYTWGWRNLSNPASKRINIVSLRADITDSLAMKGEAFVSSNDVERMERTTRLKKGKDDFVKHYFTDRNTETKIEEFEVENQESDSLPLLQKFKFIRPVGNSGEYNFFHVNLFTGLEKNPFLIEERFSDVFFGRNQSYMINASISLPQGYVFEETPKNIRMITPDSSLYFTRISRAEENELSVRITLDFKKPFYSTEEYPNFKEFYKMLFEMLNDQFVFKKKATPKP